MPRRVLREHAMIRWSGRTDGGRQDHEARAGGHREGGIPCWAAQHTPLPLRQHMPDPHLSRLSWCGCLAAAGYAWRRMPCPTWRRPAAAPARSATRTRSASRSGSMRSTTPPARSATSPTRVSGVAGQSRVAHAQQLLLPRPQCGTLCVLEATCPCPAPLLAVFSPEP